MKKYFLLYLLTILICSAAWAQTITATGNVRDVNGNMLHYAFIQNKQYKNGTFTDSLGNFALETKANSMLAINCAGYKDTLVAADGKNAISIVLHPAAQVSAANGSSTANAANGNQAVVQTALRDQVNLSQNTPPAMMQQGSIMPVIHTKEATQGSRYYFKDWVHGYIVNAGDSLVQNPGFLLNYDKISGSLILTQDRVSVIAIYKDKVKSFTLFDALNQPLTFTIVPQIDKTHYVQVIAAGNNYGIYKLTKTKFVESNYSSDGLASTGNNYDEYADEGTYYVIGKGGAPQKISLRKKALKEAFSADQGKLNQYFQANNADIDDNYLKDLGDYMNR